MESEQQTRKKRIDGRLVYAGWKFVPFKSDAECAKLKNHALEERPIANWPADYALIESGGAVGVLEAKKVTVGAKVLTQAERYSKGVPNSPLNFDGYRAPFLYSTNGELTHFHEACQ